MRAVVQRVARASVTVGEERLAEIGRGFLVLLGMTHDDTVDDAAWISRKIAGLRVFDDEDDHMNLSLRDVGGSVLVVSQFTLYGDAVKGNRPSFVAAARPEQAEPLYRAVVDNLRAELGRDRVGTGRFGADMRVELVNDGPVTILLEGKGNRAGAA
ncbi:MAG: D-tyrosyl-tRNA(Tyr) deacylase [Kiritimatiellae bacterium]|nr:D-tyrosyl-tRNA(Tyr) deacylase [Kiritimatiellia bacterium]